MSEATQVPMFKSRGILVVFEALGPSTKIPREDQTLEREKRAKMGGGKKGRKERNFGRSSGGASGGLGGSRGRREKKSKNPNIKIKINKHCAEIKKRRKGKKKFKKNEKIDENDKWEKKQSPKNGEMKKIKENRKIPPLLPPSWRRPFDQKGSFSGFTSFTPKLNFLIVKCFV